MKLLCIDNFQAENHLIIGKIYNGIYIERRGCVHDGWQVNDPEIYHGIPFYKHRFKEIHPNINKNIKIL